MRFVKTMQGMHLVTEVAVSTLVSVNVARLVTAADRHPQLSLVMQALTFSSHPSKL